MKKLVVLLLVLFLPIMACAENGYLALQVQLNTLLGENGIAIENAETPDHKLTIVADLEKGQLVLMGEADAAEGTVWLHLEKTVLLDVVRALCLEWDDLSLSTDDGWSLEILVTRGDSEILTATSPEEAVLLEAALEEAAQS